MKKLLLLAVLLVIVVLGARSCHYNRSLSAADPSDETREMVTIAKGSSVTAVAELLEERGVIRSAWAFRRYVEKEEAEGDVKAGTFVLMRSMDAEAVLKAITEGKTGELVITIPEGYTVKDIDALLAEKGLSEPGEVMRCAQTCDFSTFDFLPSSAALAPRGGKLEGYLYPDTYFVTVSDFEAKFFLERMLGTFRAKVVNEHADDIAASGRDLHKIVTMASLVEKETRRADERPIVSGILWKRLDEGISLGVDAAVRYIVDKPTAAITVTDLDTDSPYNLRKYRGLPPGPIANPGLDSIEAALEPEGSAYYYYLHGTDGQIRYARTNDEHNANRARYLR